MTLLDSADVAQWLGVDSVPVFSQQIAEGAVTGYCGWHIAPVVTETITVDADGSVVLLPSLRVVDVTSVTDADGATVEHTVDTAGVLRLHGARRGRLTVVLKHGYDECPDAVAGVVLSVLGRAVTNPRGLVQAQETRGPVTRSESYGASANEIGATGLLASERAVLDRYRLP